MQSSSHSGAHLPEPHFLALCKLSWPECNVQIIVVPIYWNRKPEEKAEVVQGAQQVVDLITTAGIQVGMDTTNALSPGQKFAHW